MKIVIDKIGNGEPHSITKQDIHLLMAKVPKEWRDDVKCVHLRNSLPDSTVASLHRSILSVYSRGMAKDRVLQSMLLQMAAQAVGQLGVFGRLSTEDRAKLLPAVTPILEALKIETSEPLATNAISLSGFKELSFK